LGAAAAGTILSFFSVLDLFSVLSISHPENSFPALFTLGALYGTLLWARAKYGIWTSIAVFVVPPLALTTAEALDPSLLPLIRTLAWLMPSVFMFPVFLELSHRIAMRLSPTIPSGRRGIYQVVGILLLVGGGVPFVILSNFLDAAPNTGAE